MSTAEIELRDVRKVYYKDRIKIPVLEGLNLTVTAGEFVVLMGPSGSGKSTLLHLIGGLDSPNSGSVHVGDTRPAAIAILLAAQRPSCLRSLHRRS